MAISVLTISGLVHDQDGKEVPVSLKSTVPPADLIPIKERMREKKYTQDVVRPPPGLPSKLPLPDDFHLNIQLGSIRGSGRTCIVHNVDLLTEADLPSLVCKVALPSHRASIAHEAWLYNDMEPLQGVVVPRCYGWFEAELPEGHTLGTWFKETSGAPVGLLPYWNDKHLEYIKTKNYVSVLLLERLGERKLPRPLRGPEAEDVWRDVEDMFNDISRMGIIYNDIRYENILHAPEEPTALPSLPSPFHGRPCPWRVIDFEFAVKSTTFHKYSTHLGYIDQLLGGLEQGVIISPY